MIRTNGLFDGEDHIITEQKGIFRVIEHQRDLTVSPSTAMYEYFMSKMNVRRKQLLAVLDGN